jgi:hypothetical protein
VGIIFRNKGGRVKYDKAKLFGIKPASITLSSFLFKRDFSGRPGLFLTGNISRGDIDKITQITKASKNIHSNPDIQKFVKDKILWFPRGKLVSNRILFNTLKDQRKKELSGIFDQFEKNSKKIAGDVIKILTKDLPERTLLTIMVHKYGDKEAKFVGQIREYSEFFRRGGIIKKIHTDEELTCSVCNRKKLIGTFTEKPLPFYIADKPMFFQNADPRHPARSFPVCDNCYLELHKGIQFIQNKLDYRLSSVQSIQKSEINFWLIPHLNDNEPVS